MKAGALGDPYAPGIGISPNLNRCSCSLHKPLGKLYLEDKTAQTP